GGREGCPGDGSEAREGSRVRNRAGNRRETGAGERARSVCGIQCRAARGPAEGTAERRGLAAPGVPLRARAGGAPGKGTGRPARRHGGSETQNRWEDVSSGGGRSRTAETPAEAARPARQRAGTGS